jgi:hypothetical protein
MGKSKKKKVLTDGRGLALQQEQLFMNSTNVHKHHLGNKSQNLSSSFCSKSHAATDTIGIAGVKGKQHSGINGPLMSDGNNIKKTT